MLSLFVVSGCASVSTRENVYSEEQQPFRSSAVASLDEKNEGSIRRNIIALGDKTRLRAKVRVYNNNVLLVGETENAATKEKLEVFSARRGGIKRVFNRIDVASPLPSYKGLNDLLLRTRIGFAMAGVKEFDATRIDYFVDRNRVHLMGLVSRQEAEIMIGRFRRIEGVQEVVVLFFYID